MKVLVSNLSYTQNQNYKKKNVNFEAVRVDADAIRKFNEIAPATSLTQQLMYCANRNYLGKKVQTVVRAITGIQEDVPLQKVFDGTMNSYNNTRELKQDIFVRAKYEDGELGQLQSAIGKARDEAYTQTPLRENPDAYKPLEQFKLPEEAHARTQLATKIITEEQIRVFDQLWDEEGTECNKLKKLIEGFVEEANSEGHHVKKEDIVPFATELEANEKTAAKAREFIDEAKETANKTVTEEMVAKWFAPKTAAES